MTQRSDDLFIRRSLLRLLVEHTPTSVFGNLAVAAVATGVLTYAERGPVVAVWAAVIIAIAAARVLFYRRVAAALTQADIAGLDRIEAQIVALVGINGLIWGL
ncbi:MAG TPA: hypothetical protein VIL32_06690, partial [Steroidobacteraceae bacterium]